MNPPPDPSGDAPTPVLGPRGVQKVMWAGVRVETSNEREAAIVGGIMLSLLYTTVINREKVAKHTALALERFGFAGVPASDDELDDMTLRFRNVYCPSDA
jgi:hypothetical protein